MTGFISILLCHAYVHCATCICNVVCNVHIVRVCVLTLTLTNTLLYVYGYTSVHLNTTLYNLPYMCTCLYGFRCIRKSKKHLSVSTFKLKKNTIPQIGITSSVYVQCPKKPVPNVTVVVGEAPQNYT